MSMAKVQQLDKADSQHEGRIWFDLVSRPGAGSCVLSLPAALQQYQGELEILLGKVFAGRPQLPENLALAQQMSLNWCQAKSQQLGVRNEVSFE